MSHGAADSSSLILGVSGARGIVGESMTPAVASRFAAAFGGFLADHEPGEAGAPPLVMIGRDSRPSGGALASAAAAALAAAGCRVIDIGVQATPTVGVMIDELEAQGGMVITASHNPAQWNGLKCLNADGVAPPPDDAARIIDRFRRSDDSSDSAVAAAKGDVEIYRGAAGVHVDRVLGCVHAEPIRAARLSVVLDSVNGAGGAAGRTLLDSLGVVCTHINGDPTGDFAHTPEPVEENLDELCEAVAAEGAAAGFAQDPDADRLAIVDDRGRYIGEEYTLLLCAKRVLDEWSSAAARGGDGRIYLATNLSTSRMIDDLASRYPGVTVLRTAVGEANVVAALKGRGQRGLLGGEGNGGVIYPAVCWVRDSLSAMALVLALLARERRPLSEIVDDLPRYAMVKRKIDLTAIGGRAAAEEAIARVRREFPRERINDADGVRIDFEHGWVHLRPSNTEPIMRLIAEAATPQQADDLIARIRRLMDA